MLGRHVADVELEHFAVAAGQSDDPGRVVGVDVHLHELRLANDQHRVAESLDLVADDLDVERAALDQELCAVTPSTFGQVERHL